MSSLGVPENPARCKTGWMLWGLVWAVTGDADAPPTPAQKRPGRAEARPGHVGLPCLLLLRLSGRCGSSGSPSAASALSVPVRQVRSLRTRQLGLSDELQRLCFVLVEVRAGEDVHVLAGCCDRGSDCGRTCLPVARLRTCLASPCLRTCLPSARSRAAPTRSHSGAAHSGPHPRAAHTWAGPMSACPGADPLTGSRLRGDGPRRLRHRDCGEGAESDDQRCAYRDASSVPGHLCQPPGVSLSALAASPERAACRCA